MQSQLRSIKLAAEAMTNLMAPLIASRGPLASIEIPSLELVSSPDLRPHFDDLSIRTDAVLELTQAFDKAAAAMRKICAEKYQDSCRQLLATRSPAGCSPLPDLFQRLRCTFQDTYESHLRLWINEHLFTPQTRFAHAVATTPPGRTSVTRKSFNYEYVPLLEKYFGFDPFPSQADKTLLARESGMTYRQIDVWFQNRRSRAKKDGKMPKKSYSHKDSKILHKIMQELMGDRITPESALVDPVDSDVSEYEWQYDSVEEDTSAWTPRYPRNFQSPDVLDAASPPHAFPSAYPPTCGYDPFPIKEGKCPFPPVVWMRHPSSSIKRQSLVDLDKLINDFTRLTVRDHPGKRLVKKDPRKPTDPKRLRAPPPRPDRSAATLFITTRPLPAPIPALIRSTIPIHVTLPSPVASNSTLSEKHTRRRKLAPLPRRKPANTSNPRQGGTPATPGTIVLSPVPPSSHSSISRESSFGSEFSSQTRISSDSSSASSVVVTPESSSTPLPEHLSTSFIPENLGNLHEFLSDPSSGRLSPVQGIRLSLPSVDGFHVGAEKQRFEFTFNASPHTNLGYVPS